MLREHCVKGGKNIKGTSFVLVLKCAKYLIKVGKRAGEMFQWFIVLVHLEKDPGSVPSTHTVAHNHL